MATDNMLLHIDVLMVDGKPVAIEDGTGSLEGAAGFENEIVPSGTGDDFSKRKRVPRTLAAKIQFGPSVSPGDYKNMNGVQITARDSQSGRRVLLNKCSFGKMGPIGAGSVDITFNVLSEPQWL